MGTATSLKRPGAPATIPCLIGHLPGFAAASANASLQATFGFTAHE
jgi:hypothetical protein